jgi:ferredoxin--NADP+ reductase
MTHAARPEPNVVTDASEAPIGESPIVEFPIPAGVFAEKVISVRHYTDFLFSFRITRPQSFRFRSGEFVMIGLPNAAKPVFRAYSIASPAWDDELEFFSIKVEDGPLTKHLQKIRPGDTVLMRQKSTGTLVLDALTPGRRLWMIATGTGIAPFASIMRDPETYEKFEQVFLTHTCREVAELAYGEELAKNLVEDPLIGELVEGRFVHYATATREPYVRTGRITTLIETGKLFSDLGVPPFDPAVDRVMICGSMDMLRDVKALVEKAGLKEGSNAQPAEFVVERAFVD